MAKLSSRRRSVLEDPDEVLNLAQRGLDAVQRQWKWLLLAAAVLVAALVVSGVQSRMAAAREDRAAAALVQLRAKFPAEAANAEAAKALQELVEKNAGTKAAFEAQLQRANMLYQLKNYAEAAKAYEGLSEPGDPAWNNLVAESLSYCYEGLGEFKKAAATLKPLVESSTGPFQGEVLQHLALLYDKAGEPKEAAEYWRKLLEQKPNPILMTYLQGKLAAAEAQAGAAKK
jgi:lipopolysaccharide biosynthesis regulator YciM